MTATPTVIQGDSISQTVPPTIVGDRHSVWIPGTFRQTPLRLCITDDIFSKHILLIGATGCGKTNVFNFFVQQLKGCMTKDDVMIVFDTKGDFVNKFRQPGDVILANSKAYAGRETKWNIYKEITVDGWDDENLYQNTHEITRSFFQEATERTTQPFFPNAARDLLASIIIAQLRLGRDDLAFRRNFLHNKALQYYLDTLTPQKIRKLLNIEPFSDLAAVLTYIGDGSSNQALGVLAELQNVMRQILLGAFADDGRFSVRNFVREKGAKTLFIEYDLSIGRTLSPIYRLLFDLALKEAMGRNQQAGRVYLICDEFRLLPNLQHIEDGVNFGRSLGVKIIAGLQSIEQLYEIYGPSRGRNIAAGFSSVFSFKANDTSTREFVSALYGRNIVLERYGTSNGRVEERREGKTVEDWDLNGLRVGEAIVGLPFEKPFRFQFDLFNR